MQRLSSKTLQNGPGRGGQTGRSGPESRAIDGVTHERVADMGHMNPDLVGAAGLQPAFDEARDGFSVLAGEALQNAPMGDRGPATGSYRDLVAAPRMAAERGVDRALRCQRRAPDEGQVGALKGAGPAMVSELRRQRLMGTVGPGHHHQPGG